MATQTMNPAGWYTDPSGRHEARYWDGTSWTSWVSDHGATTAEAPELPATQTPTPAPTPTSEPSARPAPPGAPTPQPAVPPSTAPLPAGYRAVAVPQGRVAALKVAQLAAALAFFYEVVASVYLSYLVNQGAATTLPSRGSFQWSSWLYHYGATLVIYGYPPVGVWLALLVAMITTAVLTLTPLQAIKKAGYPGWTARSALAERARLIQGLRQLGCATTLLRARGRYGLLVVAEIGSLALIGFAVYAMTAKHGLLLESQTYRQTLTVGVGPVVCLVAGIVAAVAVALAWPWSAERKIVLSADGSLRTDQSRG